MLLVGPDAEVKKGFQLVPLNFDTVVANPISSSWYARMGVFVLSIISELNFDAPLEAIPPGPTSSQAEPFHLLTVAKLDGTTSV